MTDDPDSNRRVYVLLTILGVLILGYVFGAFSARFRTFPYTQLLEKPFRAFAAWEERRALTEGSVLRTGLWHRARTSRTGVTISKSASPDELTLYTSGHHTGAFLIDGSGDVVHEWSASFRDVWPDPPHVSDPVPESRIYGRRAHLYPNGDILASYSGEGDTPYGYGLAKFDADSNLLWKFSGHVHHDFALRDDGSIVALAHEFRNFDKRPVEGLPQFRKQALEDGFVILSPNGDLRKSFSVVDALADSRYRELLEMYPTFIRGNLEARWDPLHANTVNLVGPDFAEHHEFADPGDIVTSFRNADAVAIVDPAAERVVWAERGFWRQQHDPDPLPDGDLLVFDNNGMTGPGGASRLLEFDPATNAITWSYRGTRDEPFWSIGRSSQQVLPNDHLLVTESAGGRIFEITRDGDIVWAFHNPVRRRARGRSFVPIVCGATRHSRSDLPFLP